MSVEKVLDNPKVNGANRSEKTGRFLPGNNAGGRPLGSRSRLSEGFFTDLAKVWEKQGIDIIERVARDDPSILLRTVGALMPRQLRADFETLRTVSVELLGNMGQHTSDDPITPVIQETPGVVYDASKHTPPGETMGEVSICEYAPKPFEPETDESSAADKTET